MIIDKYRIILYGLGAIGSEVAKLVLKRPSLELVAAIDSDPAKAGRDLGEVISLDRRLGITVTYDADTVLRTVDGDVVLHSTGSHLTKIYSELALCVAGRKNVVSCAEELVNPWVSHPEIARRLDERAHDAAIAILGIGASPSFVVDTLSLVLAGACQDVRAVRVSRTIDIAKYPLSTQLKFGIGLSLDQFQRRAAQGGVGHVGLNGAAFLLAEGLGWRLDELVENLEPLPARERYQAANLIVEKGRVAGLHQTIRGVIGDRNVIVIDLNMVLGAREIKDTITIEGKPPISLTLPGGLSDDEATVGLMVNAVPFMTRARPGLLTLRDVPLSLGRRQMPRLMEEILFDKDS